VRVGTTREEKAAVTDNRKRVCKVQSNLNYVEVDS